MNTLSMWAATHAPLMFPLDAVAPPGADKIQTVVNWLSWIGNTLAIVGIIIVAITMFFQNKRGEGGESGSRLGWVMAGLILLGAASGIATALTS